MELSDEKKNILAAGGRVAVRAGPGSGKTLLLAKRLADTIQRWPHHTSGVAVLSFTNGAHEEIQRQAHKHFEVEDPVRYPHFLGTIDSFVNAYIFLPFGHIAMGCRQRPDLVGSPHGWFPRGPQWAWGLGNAECHKGAGCKLEDFTYDINGGVVNQRPRARSKFDTCPNNHRACQRVKTRFTASGYATQSDANYFAMKLLKERSEIAKALVRRFPVMMVDEAQDSSDVQMQIVDILVANGLSDVFMVGDPDQAIYEWRSAKPELLRRKCDEWSPGLSPLNENWRSSQVICDFASRISSLPQGQVAKRDDVKNTSLPQGQVAKRDDVKNMPHGPEFWSYERHELPHVIERFKLACGMRGVDLARARIAVVARSAEIVRLIRAGKETPKPPLGELLSPWPDALPEARDIALSAFFFSQRRFAASMRLMTRVACSLEGRGRIVNASAVEDFVNRHGFVPARVAVFRLLKALPAASGTLAKWCPQANAALAYFSRSFLQRTEPVELKVKAGKHSPYYDSLDFLDEFADELEDEPTDVYHVGTVHSVKGQTVDALLLVLKKKDGAYYPRMLGDRIANRAGEMCEALRIVYVAFTRPRRLLITAVPSSEIAKWREVLPEYVPTTQQVNA